jgi:hypothetical protein
MYFCVETIKCKAPNYEAYGAVSTTVSVQIGGEGWTVNQLVFSYFANTAPKLCLAFGPGLLQVWHLMLAPLYRLSMEA